MQQAAGCIGTYNTRGGVTAQVQKITRKMPHAFSIGIYSTRGGHFVLVFAAGKAGVTCYKFQRAMPQAAVCSGKDSTRPGLPKITRKMQQAAVCVTQSDKENAMGSLVSWNLQQAWQGCTIRLQGNSQGNCHRQPFVLEFKAREAGVVTLMFFDCQAWSMLW